MYWTVILILIIWLLCTRKVYKWIYMVYKTLPRDIRAVRTRIKIAYINRGWERNDKTLPTVFRDITRRNPDKIAFHFEDETWTFQQLEDFSNKIANYFLSLGYDKGDTVCLLLENRPEHVGIWLGLCKLGVITALINTNLVSRSLLHSISTAHGKALIFGSDFIDVVDSIKSSLGGLQLYHYNTTSELRSYSDGIGLKCELTQQSTLSPEKQISQLRPKDKLMYIFTSGTTGLPKAATITHGKYMVSALGIYIFPNLKDTDIYYNPLPLYHTAGALGAGQSLCFGVTVVIRKHFSASNFWTDCIKYKCTIANYIGETCRYILAANKGRQNIQHGVKKMIGNGLKKEIWEKFVETFHITEIYELYGATEGNAHLANLDHKVGAIGFLPWFASLFYPVLLIKYDEDSTEPIRDENGFCKKCKVNEAGILIGKIHQNDTVHNFYGYTDENDTNKKILRNVFKPGDAYYNTGDILVKDELGYFYFKDRTGDTFRWKGENVATSEIEYVIAESIGLNTNVVYGVEVPGYEGKVGMAAIADPDNSVNLNDLAEGFKSNLPSYAIPRFLRIMDSLPQTGTFKVKRVQLQKDGFDINVITDPMYYFDLGNVTFIPLRTNVYDKIITGNIKL